MLDPSSSPSTITTKQFPLFQTLRIITLKEPWVKPWANSVLFKLYRYISYLCVLLAEREGFEPPIRLPVCRISSAVLSTTQPPLRGRKGANIYAPAMYPTQAR
jgi:hypothetical protein